MQKPWSFKTIEFIIYVQIGLALVVSSYGILFLVVREVLTYGHPFYDQMPTLNKSILTNGFKYWQLLIAQLMYASTNMPKSSSSAGYIFGLSKLFFFELIMSSIVLFVLKTKRLIIIKNAAIILLIIRIDLFNIHQIAANDQTSVRRFYISFFIGGYSLFFAVGTILLVAFLFFKPVERYIKVRS